MTNLDPRMVAAINAAVHSAVAAVGIDGVRRMSMFPSAARAEQRLAA
ncbi:hypothetical protein [Sphingomonas hankookensis]|nr:hypothetical protein [Sphingomonas hankookensis]